MSSTEINGLLSYFDLKDVIKTGNFYRNTIFIQDTLTFKLQSNRELNQIGGLYFSYTYSIPLLSNNISVSSNHHIVRNEISDKGYDNIVLVSGDSTFRGKLKKVEHLNDYSIITMIDDETNTETSIKVKEYNIKRELNKTKNMELTLMLPEKVINNNITINVIYSIEQCYTNNDFWFFHHYLYINNSFEGTTAYGTMIYESKEGIDDFYDLKLTTKIFIKPLCIGEKNVRFKKINFIDKYVNKQPILKQQRENQDMAIPGRNKLIKPKEYDEEEQHDSEYSPHGVLATNVTESIGGDILLSSGMETSYLIKSDKLKGRILNIVELDVLSINEDSFLPLKPVTIILFVVNYSIKGDVVGIIGKNTIPHIPQGKLTIYGMEDNKVENEVFLTNSNGNDIILTPQTDKLNLGESTVINITYKLLKNEVNYKDNSTIKIIRLKLTNLSHLPTRTNIKFTHVDFIIVLQSNTISIEPFNGDDEPYQYPEFDFTQLSEVLNDKYHMIFQSKENSTILLDFVLQPNSDEYVVLYIKLK